MNKVNRAITSFTAGIFFTLIYSLPALAADVVVNTCPSDSDFKALCDLQSNKISDVVSGVLVLLLVFAVIIALIFLIYGGIKWILSGGDKSAVEGARNHIIAAIVGLIIAFGAFFILNLITQIFLNKQVTQLTLPSLTGQ